MKESVCQPGISYRQLLVHINAEPAGIAFITNREGKLEGVFTDGDFRRFLLSGGNLDDVLARESLKPFVSAQQGEGLKDLLAKTDLKVRFVPVLDAEGRLVDYFRYEHKVRFTPVAEPDLGGNELNYVIDAVTSTWISSSGKYISDFEKNFAAFTGTKHGIAVSNGTVALHLALKALNIGPGDEVIVPDLTFAATINAVLYTGATPVIVDVEPESWCLCPQAFREAVTAHTKAVIPVHVYGQPASMKSVMDVARESNIFVIEDCAEAHGSRFNGQPTGSFGDIACYSFYGNKIITTGEGGMCVTSRDDLAEKMRVLRDHGMNKQKRYWHDEVGFNYRMTNMQAALGCAQLERVRDILKWRKSLETDYRQLLERFPWISWQPELQDREKVVWLVSLLVPEEVRDELMSSLRQHGVDIRPFFYPLSAMPLYRQYLRKPAPVSESLSKRGLNLPTVRNTDMERVLEAFRQVKVLEKTNSL